MLICNVSAQPFLAEGKISSVLMHHICSAVAVHTLLQSKGLNKGDKNNFITISL